MGIQDEGENPCAVNIGTYRLWIVSHRDFEHRLSRSWRIEVAFRSLFRYGEELEQGDHSTNDKKKKFIWKMFEIWLTLDCMQLMCL